MKIVLPVLIFVLGFLLVYPVLAQDSTNSGLLPREKAIGRLENNPEKRTERMETRQEKMASRAAALKTKLETFRNKTKAQLVEKISNNLNRINSQRTSRMSQNIDLMSNILTKAASRAGANPSASASAALETAKQSLSSASAAILTQSQKDYTVTVSSEATAKTNVKTMRDQLQKDLQSTHKLVINARKTVKDAIRVIAREQGEVLQNGQ